MKFYLVVLDNVNIYNALWLLNVLYVKLWKRNIIENTPRPN